MPGPIAAAAGLVTAGLGGLLGGAGRATAYAANIILPNETLGIEVYLDMFRMRWIGQHEMRGQLRQIGFDVTPKLASSYDLFVEVNGKVEMGPAQVILQEGTILDRYVTYSKPLPSASDARELFNRGLITEQVCRYIHNAQNGAEIAMTDAQMQLINNLPGFGDVLSCEQNNVFNSTVVNTYGLDSEQSQAYIDNTTTLGFNGIVPKVSIKQTLDRDNKPQDVPVSWSQVLWWNHWRWPDPNTYREIIFRNYEDSIYGPNPEVDPQDYASASELSLLQKVAGIPPGLRRKLNSVISQPLPLRHLKALYAKNLLRFDEKDRSLFHAVKKSGFSDADAEMMCKEIVLTAREDILDVSLKQIDSLYENGVLSRTSALLKLQDLFYPSDQANLHLNNIDLDVQLKRLDTAKRLTKQAFLGGDISRDDALGLLLKFGMDPQYTIPELDLWGLELTLAHKYVTAQQGITFYRNGIINEDQLRNKLTWLHYRSDEVELMITNTKFELLQRSLGLQEKSLKQTQKLQDQLDKQNAKTQAQIKKQAETQQKIKTKAIAAQTKAAQGPFSEKNIISFANAGYLDYKQVVKVLTDKGWLLPDINRWIIALVPKIKGVPNGLKESVLASESESAT